MAILFKTFVTIRSVYDADTFRGDIKGMGRYKHLGINTPFRLHGIDTPEKGWRASCDAERILGEDATRFVKNFLTKGSTPVIGLHDTKDKYGRFLVNVDTGKGDLADLLIAHGLAKPYDGGTKPSWC